MVTILFAISTIAAYLRPGGHHASLAAAIYQGVFVGMALSFPVLFWWGIRRGHMKIPLTPEGARRATIRFAIGNVAYLAAIWIAFLSATASLIVSGRSPFTTYSTDPRRRDRNPGCRDLAGHGIRGQLARDS